MSELSTSLTSSAAVESVKDIIGFNKKNAWKNEWEKAQLNTQESANKKASADKQAGEQYPDSGLRQQISQPASQNAENYNSGINSAHAVNSHQLQSQGLTALAQQKTMLATETTNTAEKPQMLPANMVLPEVVQKVSQLQPLGLKQSNYVQGIIEQAEVKYRSLYKLQNLNLIMSENGAKLILRDYRLDKNQLALIVEQVSSQLSDLGVNVSEVIINGVVHD